MRTPRENFPKKYAALPLPAEEGPWYEAVKCVHGMLKKGTIVVLYGNRGTGKTFMAYTLADHAEDYPDPLLPKPAENSPDHARPAIYRTAMGLFLELRNTFRKDSEESELDIMRNLQDAVLLVIDEIQEKGETRWEDQKLTAIVDARYGAGRPTLLIGNYRTREEFESSVSPSIIDRLNEGGGAIRCNWPSFRGRQ